MGRAASMLVVALFVSFGIWVTRSDWPVKEQVLPLYIAALVVQVAHFAEEYRTGFHRAFPPVFGAEPWSNRRFLMFNVIWLLVFAMAAVGLARGKRVAYLVALFLALAGGIGNGIGHLALSARVSGYFPGAYTSVLALVIGAALAFRLLRKPITVQHAAHR